MRTRRTWSRRLAISGGTLAALVLALWLASRWWPVHGARPYSYVGLDRGRLYIGYTDAPADPRLLASIVDGVKTSGYLRTRWMPRSGRGWGSNAGSNGRFFYTIVAIPVLPIAGGIAVVTGVGFLLLYRRTPPRCCAECGYDLRGLPAARCPECGRTERLLTALIEWARVRIGRGARWVGAYPSQRQATPDLA